MSRRRKSRSGRLGLWLLAVMVVLLAGAVWNSGGAAAVSWAFLVAAVAVTVQSLAGRRSGRRRTRRTRSRVRRK